MNDDLGRYVDLMSDVYPEPSAPPTLLRRAKAIHRIQRGESLDDVAAQTALARHWLVRWRDAVADKGLFY